MSGATRSPRISVMTTLNEENDLSLSISSRDILISFEEPLEKEFLLFVATKSGLYQDFENLRPFRFNYDRHSRLRETVSYDQSIT